MGDSSSNLQNNRSASSSTGKRVLFVEDDANQRRMICLAFRLKYPEHELKTAGSAGEVFELLEKFAPEVLVVDFGLPDMAGCELGQKLRADPRTSNALMISLSGRGEPEDFQRSEEAGFARHMVKPPELSVLESWFHQ